MNFSKKIKRDSRKTLLSLSWRDIKSPAAGGAEVQTHEMLKGVDHSRYRVIHLSPAYGNEPNSEEIDNVIYLRKGNMFSVILYAIFFYKKNRDEIDYVLDQCNTHRFFSSFWVARSKRIFYIHQLTREIWDINLKFPFNKIGKYLETPLLRLNRKDYTIALSDSTREDLLNIGFQPEKTRIIPIAMKIKPWKKNEFYPKEKCPTFIYVGRYVVYKGIDAALEAFGMLKQQYPDSKLWLLGKKNKEYVQEELEPLCRKYHLSTSDGEESTDITFWGFVSEEKKLELLSRSTALVFPSNREGWGIPISEAAYVGTPSIVYNTQGLRDAVNLGKAGYLCDDNTPSGLLKKMSQAIDDKEKYSETVQAAYDFSINYLDRNTGKLLEELIELIGKERD